MGEKTEEQRALELAYRAISARDRTVAELRTWLESRELSPNAIERAIEQVAAAGFLDDARFARQFAEDKRHLERWGNERIARDLRRRGVDPELIEVNLAASRPEDELRAAITLLAEKLPPITSDRERDRAWRMLVRKGYTPELAYDAVREHGRRAA